MRDDELVTVYSSKEMAQAEAEVLRSLLESAGIHAIIKWVPPTFQGSGGIRLLTLSSEAEDAAEIIRDAQLGEEALVADIEMVNVFSSSNHDAEAEADVILGLLRSADITAEIRRENVQELPAGRVEVKVPSDQADDARSVIEAAQQEGKA